MPIKKIVKNNRVSRPNNFKSVQIKSVKANNNYNYNCNNKYKNNNKENNENNIIIFKELEDHFINFNEYCFFLIDLIDHYLSNIFKETVLSKKYINDFKNYVYNDFKKEFKIQSDNTDINNVKQINCEIRNIENNKYTKDKLESIKEILNSNIDSFLSKNTINFISSFIKQNNSCKNDLNNILKLQFILPFNTENDFINNINYIRNKRNYLEHRETTEENKYCDKNFFNALMKFLPIKYIDEFLQIINKYIKKLKINNVNIELIQKKVDKLEEDFNQYKIDRKIFIEKIYSQDLKKIQNKVNISAEERRKENYNNKKRRENRIQILYGKYKDKKTKEEKILKWKQHYDNYRLLYEKTFGNCNNFYKITTFKQIYFFISEENIEKIENYLFEIAKKYSNKIYYKFLLHEKINNEYCFTEYNKEMFVKNILKFSYIEEFYFSMIKINFLLNKSISYIKQYFDIDNNYDIIKDKTGVECFKNIRNNLKHNKLFCFVNEKNLNEKIIIQSILKILKYIENKEKEKKTNNLNCVYSDFCKQIRDILYKLKLPYYYNNEQNKLKNTNTIKFKKMSINKDNYIVDNKKILVLVVNNILYCLDGGGKNKK